MNISLNVENAKHVALILAVAFALRLFWAILVPVIPISDSLAYDVFARNIASGQGYGWEPGKPSAYWPVGTSAIYAVIYWLFGFSHSAVVALNIVTGVLIVSLSMTLARQWFNDTTALFTGWVLAVWPTLIQFTTILASELYFAFFVLLAFRLASLPGRSIISRAILAGPALAAAAYVRPLAVLMAPLLFLHEAKVTGTRIKPITACVLATAVMLVCIAPWTIRNWNVFERFVLISTNGGANLWMGNNPQAGTGYMELPVAVPANEADRDKFLGQEAKQYILNDPYDFAIRSGKKLVSLFDRETIGITWNEQGILQAMGSSTLKPLKVLSSGYWLLVFGLALLGCFLFARNSGIFCALTCPALTGWCYFTIVHIVTVSSDRYHMPSIPFIAMFSGYCCAFAISIYHESLPRRKTDLKSAPPSKGQNSIP